MREQIGWGISVWIILVSAAAVPPATVLRAEERSFTAPVDDQLVAGQIDWPWWRGPTRDGHARPGQRVPKTWDASRNVVWKSPVPGRGHSSPIVVGRHVYLTTADEQRGSQSVLCYDRATGERVWTTEVHHEGAMWKNAKSSAASSSVACDGERIFVNFLNRGAVYTTALTRDGRPLWQTKITDYVIHQGYGSSPALYQSLVIVSADNKGGGALAGLDRQTGQVVWRRSRPATPNYPSPIILHACRRDQLILTGCNRIASYHPLTGETLWEVEGATTECVTSTVTDGFHVYSSGGYPRNHVAAVAADGSSKIVWETGDRVYVPSMLIRDGYLYAVMDAGIAVCWKCDTGEEMWKARLEGNFSSSPVLVDDVIYATNENGATFLFRATPDKFERIAVNRLGDEAFATPAICGGQIFLRVAEHSAGGRQEMLYCVAESE